MVTLTLYACIVSAKVCAEYRPDRNTFEHESSCVAAAPHFAGDAIHALVEKIVLWNKQNPTKPLKVEESGDIGVAFTCQSPGGKPI